MPLKPPCLPLAPSHPHCAPALQELEEGKEPRARVNQLGIVANLFNPSAETGQLGLQRNPVWRGGTYRVAPGYPAVLGVVGTGIYLGKRVLSGSVIRDARKGCSSQEKRRVKDSGIKVGQAAFTSYLKPFDVSSDLLSPSPRELVPPGSSQTWKRKWGWGGKEDR